MKKIILFLAIITASVCVKAQFPTPTVNISCWGYALSGTSMKDTMLVWDAYPHYVAYPCDSTLFQSVINGVNGKSFMAKPGNIGSTYDCGTWCMTQKLQYFTSLSSCTLQIIATSYNNSGSYTAKSEVIQVRSGSKYTKGRK